ncbi:hypothetical protein FSZ31_08775 [Sphingorhabdus soli]|uniref:Uncharacterized protein n=1 Tax=Flavisphingopyxis soli TaxID=2601267 RepID=A0A5C6U7Z4_9SPHN|nr:hypothetical protein [Sphingorhabdus soli]TXC69022.1 hypothetical protein FSZ31_08775 [Sphingorhabdus soli]
MEQHQPNGTKIMKIDWKGETAAILAAFALTGIAMWGSIIPVQAVPMLPARGHPQIAVVAPGPAGADLIRKGDHA